MQARMKIFAETKLMEEQCGFRSNRGCTDMLFVARQLQERAAEYGQKLNWVFIDLKKAFDSVNRDAMWLLFKKYGIPDHFINLLKSLHVGMKVVVEFEGKHSPPISVESGVKQGCVLAPTCFGLFINKPMMTVRDEAKNLGVPIEYKMNGKLKNARIVSKDGQRRASTLLFADDTALVDMKYQVLEEAAQKTFEACASFGLTVNTKKTQSMLASTIGQKNLSINGET
jgi:hypothetical protein